MGWLTGWKYRKSLKIIGTISEQENYPVRLKLFYEYPYRDSDLCGDAIFIQDSVWGHAVLYDNKLFFGAMQLLGTETYACEYDLDTKSFKKVTLPYTAPSADGHYIPGFFMDVDGYFWAFAGYLTNGIYWMKSTFPYSIDDWDEKVKLCNEGSYPWAYQDPLTKRLYVTYRNVTAGCFQRAWTDDGGQNWTIDQNTMWGDGYYCSRFWQSSNNRLHWSSTGGPKGGGDRENVYYAYSDDFGTTWKDASGTTITSPELVWEGDSTRVSMNLDENGYPMIVTGFRYDTSSDLRVHYWNGSSWITKQVSTNYIAGLLPTWAIHKVEGRLHIFTTRKFYGEWILTHYYADSPYDSWTEKTNLGRLAYSFAGFIMLLNGIFTFVYNLASNMGKLEYPKTADDNLNANCRTDFGDIRFTKDDGTTEMDYWIQEKVNNNYAIFWIKVPVIPASPSEATIFFYYGNESATYPFGDDQSKMDAIFLFSDHFYGSSLDDTKWDVIQGTPVVSGSEIKLSGSGDRIKSKSTFTEPKGYGFACRMASTAQYHHMQMVHDATSDYNYASAGSGHLAVVLSNYYSTTYTSDRYINTVYTKIAVGPSKVDSTFSRDYEVLKAADGVTKGLIKHVQEWQGTEDQLTSGYVFLYSCNASDKFWDWIFVRKYISPEPTLGTWGSEEEAGPILVSPINGVEVTSPVYLRFTSTIPLGARKHFELQVDKSSSVFEDLELDLNSENNQTNWEYWDGSQWVQLPSTGLPSSKFGNDVRYYATLIMGQKWWRARERIWPS